MTNFVYFYLAVDLRGEGIHNVEPFSTLPVSRNLILGFTDFPPCVTVVGVKFGDSNCGSGL